VKLSESERGESRRFSSRRDSAARHHFSRDQQADPELAGATCFNARVNLCQSLTVFCL
jgi:hypothetical protein